jgi:hypothetical protein
MTPDETVDRYYRLEPRRFSRLNSLVIERLEGGVGGSHLRVAIALREDLPNGRLLTLEFEGVTGLRIDPTWNIDDHLLFLVNAVADRQLETLRFQVEDSEHEIGLSCFAFSAHVQP